MASIAGWAFTKEEKEESERRRTRYAEIKHLREALHLQVNPCYGMTKYSGTIPKDQTITDLDLALICDGGNTCFGGSVLRGGEKFYCTIFTD